MEEIVQGVPSLCERRTLRPGTLVQYEAAYQAFQQWEDMAMGMGFKYAAGGPMVRSSYRAGEFFIKHMLQHGEGGQLKKEATTA